MLLPPPEIAMLPCHAYLFLTLRQGSNELDRASSTRKVWPCHPAGFLSSCRLSVILSAAKDLAAPRARPFPALRVTIGSTSQTLASTLVILHTVILSEAKDLVADRERPSASLRVTRYDGSNGQEPFVQIGPYLNNK